MVGLLFQLGKFFFGQRVVAEEGALADIIQITRMNEGFFRERGLFLNTVSIPQLARTIPLKGLNLSLEKYRMPDGVIIEVESSSHYLGSFSEKNDSSTNWIEKIMEGVGIH